MLDVPYAGCGVLSSALCMDKVSAKKIFERMGLPTARYKLVYAEDVKDDLESVVKEVEAELPYTLFVKTGLAHFRQARQRGLQRGHLKGEKHRGTARGFGSGRKV